MNNVLHSRFVRIKDYVLTSQSSARFIQNIFNSSMDAQSESYMTYVVMCEAAVAANIMRQVRGWQIDSCYYRWVYYRIGKRYSTPIKNVSF